MFKLLNQKRGQGSAVEYATTFFLVAAFVATMTVFVQRAIQGRIKDGRRYMVWHVFNAFDSDNDGQFDLTGNIWWEYEPYYADSNIEKFHTLGHTKRHLGGGSGTSGIVETATDDYVESYSDKFDRHGGHSD